MQTHDGSPAEAAGSGGAPLPNQAARRRGHPLSAWIARAAIVAAILLFVAPWSPPAPAVLASWLARATPRSLGPFVEPVTELAFATGWRLVLVMVIGAATPWAIGASRALWWTLAWLGASGAASAVAATLLIGGLFDDSPRVTAVPPITREDRARLEEMLRLAGEKLDEDVELQLSAADLTGITAAWLASRSADTRVTFAAQADSLQCQLTQPIRGGRENPAFLNVDVELQPRILADRLRFGVTALRVGRVRVPAVVVARVSSAIEEFVGRTPQAGKLLKSISELSLAAGKLRVVVDPDRASSAFADSMSTSPAASDRLRADVRAMMQALVDECSSLPAGDERFFGLLRKAFEIAERRSTETDAAEQNRAALVALGIQIGDPRVRRLAGFPVQERMTTFPYRFDQQTTLHGRNDLARHFLVSAALRALSTRDIGMTMGLFKEQLDAVDGGSGFSFTDVAADMAGLRFADNVLDPARAAAMQRRVRKESSVATLLPSLEGLTDGLSEPMFRRLYGSLTDERYRMVILVIERRMEETALLASGRTDGRE
jgi:hypothetical protein